MSKKHKAKARKPPVKNSVQSKPVIKVINAQRYDSARPSRDLSLHWRFTDSKSVDASLDPETRRIQRERARYVIANNSWAYGAAMTIANAVVGRCPRLQLTTREEVEPETISLAERDFSLWAKRTRLGEKLKAMRFARFQDGETFGVLYSNNNLSPFGVSLDVAPLDAERVCAAAYTLDPNDVDGIKIDNYGNPLSYRVLARHPGDDLFTGFVEEATIYPANNVLHWYRRSLPEQHRGCSEISPALNLFAYLERYTRAVVTAAETAADLAMVFYTDALNDSADADYDAFASIEERSSSGPNDNPFAEIPWSRGMTITAPFGTKPAQIKAEQPTSTYAMLVDELLGEIGASIGLPRMLMKRCAAGYNYASGRLDYREFDQFISLERDSCEISVLYPLFDAWFKEWKLLNRVTFDVEPVATWFWDGQDHVDPQKEALAQNTRLQSLTTSLAREYGKQGKDWRDEIREIAEEQAYCRELGIVIPGLQLPAGVASTANQDEPETV